MDAPGVAPPPAVAAAAERLLSGSGGASVRLDRWEPLRGGDRSLVWRASGRGDSAQRPTSVIVKTAIGAGGAGADPGTDVGGPTWRLANEWASLELLGRLHPDPPVAPRLHGGDWTAGVLVIEDLGPRVGLDRVLLADDPLAAENGLLGYARALGRMHAATAAHEEPYAVTRARLAPLPRQVVSTAAEAALDGPGLAAAFRRAAALLGVSLGDVASADLDAVSAFWDAPAVRTLVHGDPCPDNCLVLGDEARLLDFEFGGFRHPLIDGACLRLCFPSCWCAGSIPEDVVERGEAAYRTALAAGCAWADDDGAFDRALVEGCAYWTVGMFAWAVPDLLGDDVEWGLASGRQRVLHRLEVFARLSEGRRHLRPLGAAASALRRRLAERWPGTEPVAVLPAFRSRVA